MTMVFRLLVSQSLSANPHEWLFLCPVSCAPPEWKQKIEKSQALRAGRRDLAPILLFNAGVPTPTSPECGYPGIRRSPSVTRNSLTQEIFHHVVWQLQ